MSTRTLHIFNPEHDLALAAGLSNFTSPHAGRQLRHDLGFLPALWARKGDVVLADDPKQAETAWRKTVNTLRRLGKTALCTDNVTFVSPSDLIKMGTLTAIDPWGWDTALRAMLLRKGVNEELMPTDAQLADIRTLSHRSEAAWLLSRLLQHKASTATISDGKSSLNTLLTGEVYECTTIAEAEELLGKYGAIVMKAPWSSSGRGLRFLNTPAAISNTLLEGWFNHLVAAQGSVMVEPYYHKVKDLGMEFYSDGAGHVEYIGLSLFHTENGAYIGNLIATESAKRESLSRLIPVGLLDSVQAIIAIEMGQRLKGRYRGPFGVDMMVVKQDECLLHPCVEINLRRTMGHVALSLNALINPSDDDDIRRAMRISYASTRMASDKSINKIYKLSFSTL